MQFCDNMFAMVIVCGGYRCMGNCTLRSNHTLHRGNHGGLPPTVLIVVAVFIYIFFTKHLHFGLLIFNL